MTMKIMVASVGGGHGNTKIPFGLCQREGIKVEPNWTPKDAWDALAGKGYSASEAYKELKETGKVAAKKSNSAIEKAEKEHRKARFENEAEKFEGGRYLDPQIDDDDEWGLGLYGYNAKGDKEYITGADDWKDMEYNLKVYFGKSKADIDRYAKAGSARKLYEKYKATKSASNKGTGKKGNSNVKWSGKGHTGEKDEFGTKYQIPKNPSEKFIIEPSKGTEKELNDKRLNNKWFNNKWEEKGVVQLPDKFKFTPYK
jgi:hypothetical protein